MAIHLEKIDPDTNCYRFYVLSIEDDLFEPHSLMVHWGRIGTRGRYAIRASGSMKDMEAVTDRILKLRSRHGYKASSSFA